MNQSKMILIFFFFIAQSTLAMDRRQELKLVNNEYDSTQPYYTYRFFDTAKKTKDCLDLKMMLSPIDKDTIVLIAKKDGVVSRFSLKNNHEERLLKQHLIKHIPMVVAIEKEGSLLVASAGNYSEDGIKKADCCIWHKGTFRTIVFSPLQAIAIDKKGDLLATADQSQNICITYLNDSGKEMKPYNFHAVSKAERFRDIAFNAQSTMIALARKSGITLMNWDSGFLQVIKRISNITDIKNIYVAEPQIIYVTGNKHVKMLEIFDTPFNKNVSFNQADDDVKSVVFFGRSFHNKIVVDKENPYSIALWTKSKNASDDLRRQIIVRKRYPKKIEEFVLEVPEFRSQNDFTNDEEYEYLSKQGYLKSRKHHFCTVALSGDNVMAISSDGKLHSWHLSEEYSNKKNKEDKNRNTLLESIHPPLSFTQSNGTTEKKIKKSSLRGSKGRSKSEDEKRSKKSAWDKLTSTIKTEENNEDSLQTSPQNTFNKDLIEEQYSVMSQLPKNATTRNFIEEVKRHSSPSIGSQQIIAAKQVLELKHHSDPEISPRILHKHNGEEKK